MASNDSTAVAVNNLSLDHLNTFTKALNSIMLTDTTRHVLAQIMDGKPVRKVTPSATYSNPNAKDLVQPSPASMDLAKRFQDNFQADTFELESEVRYIAQHAL